MLKNDHAPARFQLSLPSSPQPFVAIALAGHELLVARDDGTISWLRMADGGTAASVDQWSSPYPVSRLALSSAGRYVLEFGQGDTRVAVRDLVQGSTTARLGAGRVPIAATFVSAGGRELLACSSQRFALELLDPESGERIAGGDPSEQDVFEWDHLATVGGGRWLLAVGHYFSEGKSSLLALAAEELLNDPEYPRSVARARLPFTDYAWQLAAGPTGEDSAVMFRDPEDDEVLEPDETPSHELEGFRGFYFRDLATGRLVSRMLSDESVETGTPLLATSAWVAAITIRGLMLASRHTGSATVLAADVAAFDSSRGRAVTWSARRGFELVDLR